MVQTFRFEQVYVLAGTRSIVIALYSFRQDHEDFPLKVGIIIDRLHFHGICCTSRKII